MGTALEALIPFAAGHEIIRQGQRDSTLAGPIAELGIVRACDREGFRTR